MISFEVVYLLSGKVSQRAVSAKDEAEAWLVVFRSHQCAPELLEVRRLG
jgi:hypothetical protein